jgi:hypothetical protein
MLKEVWITPATYRLEEGHLRFASAYAIQAVNSSVTPCICNSLRLVVALVAAVHGTMLVTWLR